VNIDLEATLNLPKQKKTRKSANLPLENSTLNKKINEIPQKKKISSAMLNYGL
jgi:hypothetical protein